MKNRKLSKTGKRILTFLECVCLVVMVVSGYMIYRTFHRMDKDNSTYTSLAEQVVEAKPKPQATASSEPDMTIHWDTLQNTNNDIAAWIRQDDTPINYPIVYAPNNDYYLNLDFYGNYNIWGTPFIDYRNSHDFTDKNTVIYGHSGQYSDKVFSTLDKYRNQSYYDEHPTLSLFTPDATYALYPIAGYETDGQDDYVRTSFLGDDDYMSYIQNTFINNSTFVSHQTLLPSDQTVLLSTCQFHVEDGRFALLCKLVKVA